ncbi:BZ3500_MvSof-1268-A1-R1_Chr1-3g02338 [Microbotryum saponariae]|uniref:BZ3500_MvSof-1268-A1-R1_Chr1-3g02338 protein n=1 Tax=Microbotryum saponariae TaxID=289078 RepID=A0A2X0MH35_9BASI|nr:BZ3500_MvSof-1268-A1-R1_Chr1-3g02338 [Microbotryum saponariae]SCZ96033.1 BZ3501_MvSof-1269-A2-R1_Chr1-3g01941 [Microbotryum saponariae]
MDAQLEAKRHEIATTRLEALAAARTVGSQLPLTSSTCDPSLIIEALRTTNQFRHVAIALANEMQSPLDGEFEFELTDDHRVFLAEVVKVLQHPQAQQRFDLLDLHWGALLIEACTMAEAAKHKKGAGSVRLPPLLVVEPTISTSPFSEENEIRRGYAALFQLDKTAVKKGDVRTIDAIAAPLATATEAWMRAVIPIASEMCSFFESSTRSRNNSKTSLPTPTRSPASVPAKPADPSTPSRKRAVRSVAENALVETTNGMEVDEAAGPRSAKSPQQDVVHHPVQTRSPSVHDSALPRETGHEPRVEHADDEVEEGEIEEDLLPSTQPPLPPARSRILSRLQAAAQQQAAKFEASASTSSQTNDAASLSAGRVLTARTLTQDPNISTLSEHPMKGVTNDLKRSDPPASPKVSKRIVVSPPKRPSTVPQRIVEEKDASLEQYSSGSNGTSGSSYTSQPPPPAQTFHTPSVSTASSTAAYISTADGTTSPLDSTSLVLNTQSTVSSFASDKRKDSQSQPTQSSNKDGRSQSSTQNTDSLEYVDDVAAHKRKFEEQQSLKAAAEAKQVAASPMKEAASVRTEGNNGKPDAMDHDAVQGLEIDDMVSDDDDSVSSHLMPHRRFEELEEEATQGPEDDETMGEILSTRVSPFF